MSNKKCVRYSYCAFRLAYGYCAKDIGDECPIVWGKEE